MKLRSLLSVPNHSSLPPLSLWSHRAPVTQCPGKEQDGSMSKPTTGGEVAQMFDIIRGHQREGDELKTALAEAQTKKKLKMALSKNTTPSGHQDLDAQRFKRTSCRSPRTSEA